MIGSRLKLINNMKRVVMAILPLAIPVLNPTFSLTSPAMAILDYLLADPLATILREPRCSCSMAKKPLSVTNCMNDAWAGGNRWMSGSVSRGYVLFKVDFAQQFLFHCATKLYQLLAFHKALVMLHNTS
jgi:hypothetical protein